MLFVTPLLTLTPKQRKFAKLVADGMTQADAYTEVWGRGEGTAKTRGEVACRMANRPEVVEAIEQFQLKMEPVVDLRQLRAEMLASIRWLARESPDQRVRLAAAIDLRNYADERQERERKLLAKSPVSAESLLAELAELRSRKAAPQTLELEAVPAGGPNSAPESSAEVREDADGHPDPADAI